MRAMKTMGVVVCLALASACSKTAEGVKEDAENAAEKTAEVTEKAADKTTEAAEKTGNAVEGALETGQIKTAIITDSRVEARDINVDTDEATKTVILKGTVKTEAQRKIAAEIAMAKATGYTVVNNITVRP